MLCVEGWDDHSVSETKAKCWICCMLDRESYVGRAQFFSVEQETDLTWRFLRKCWVLGLAGFQRCCGMTLAEESGFSGEAFAVWVAGQRHSRWSESAPDWLMLRSVGHWVVALQRGVHWGNLSMFDWLKELQTNSVKLKVPNFGALSHASPSSWCDLASSLHFKI